MNDFIAGPPSGSREGGSGIGGGGTPPTVLIAAMGAAFVIAATLVGFILGSGGGDSNPAGLGGEPGAAATTTGGNDRVRLTIEVDGGGSGRVLIDPRGITCTETCDHDFSTGSRVTLSPDADTGSTFEGWSDSCSGSGRCSIVMDHERSVTVTFESSPTATSQCEDGRDNDRDGLVDEADPGCSADDTEAPNNRPAPASECSDGRDNDGDGLIDRAQDPGCASGGTEADSATPSRTATQPAAPPPPPPASECSDGRDNDGDGLIDRAQDPGCATGTTEGAAQGTSECRDGRDNDGDGLVDRPADPGCDADGTEAGGR
jgi:hypothetical protein